MTISLTDTIAEFATSLDPTALPAAVRHAARRHILDSLGIAAAATAQEFGERFRSLELATPTRAGADALGLSTPSTAEDAALVNGTLAHGLDYDDTYQPGIIHIGATVVPAALAVGQIVGAASDDVLGAVVIGYEVASRLAEAASGAFHHHGFHATPICGSFAAAAVASRLLGLPVRQTRDALGIVGSFASGLQEFLRDGSDTKRLHPGWAANAGIRAARFAHIGFTGPHQVLEGHFGLFATHVGLDRLSPDVVTDGLASTWNILRTSIKPFPACHLLHAHIEAAQTLRDSGVDPHAITRIKATIHEPGLHLLAEPIDEKRRPSTTYGAQFSLPFSIAVGFLDPQITLRSFGSDRLADAEIQRLAAVTECVIDTGSAHPTHFDGAVDVWFGDGEHRSFRVPVNLGSPERPLDDLTLAGKFRANVALTGVTDGAAAAIAEDLLGTGSVTGALSELQHAILTART